MSNIAVEKIDEEASKSPSFAQKLEKLGDRIRQRAHEIFQNRDSGGSAIEDWLQAERELILKPESELIEKDGKYEVTIAAAGFKPGELKVVAFPDSLVVSGESTHRHEENENNVHFCEFGRKSFLRQFQLPENIDANKVTANLTDGVLHVSAQKAASAGKTMQARA